MAAGAILPVSFDPAGSTVAMRRRPQVEARLQLR